MIGNPRALLSAAAVMATLSGCVGDKAARPSPPPAGAAAFPRTMKSESAPPRRWSHAGSFMRGRFWGHLQKLPDGRVILAGGLEGPPRGLSDVDLYDPKTSRWTAGPPLHEGRYEFAGIALADGRVLVSGGVGPFGRVIGTVEIFDPRTNSWSRAAPMSQVRQGHRLVLMPDGKVLAAGGYDGSAVIASAELYDPAKNAWSNAGRMSAGRFHPMMILLRSGKALIAGGAGFSSADLYDPRTNRWIPTGSMSTERFYFRGALLPDGRVLATGGRVSDESGASDTAESYDPATGRWAPAGRMGVRRYGHAMVIIDDVPLMIGGENLSSDLDSTEYYDLRTGEWRPGPSLAGGRTYPESLLLDDGRVLTVAGRRRLGGGVSLASSEVLARSGALVYVAPASPIVDSPRPPPPMRARAFEHDSLGELPPPAPLRPNAHAVVIGVERYRERLPPADFASSDARVTAEYFRRVLGVPEENLALLSDDRATKSDFEKHFERWLPNRVEAGDEVYVYFSGHGAPNPKTGEAYLVPFDADPVYIEQTGYSIDKVYEQLAKLPAKHVLLVMDSCFSGAGGRSVIARGARPLVNVKVAGIPRGLTVISASKADQISNSYHGKRHGLFTYFFLRGLKEKGPDLRAVYDYLKPHVSRTARRENNSDQEPQWREGE